MNSEKIDLKIRSLRVFPGRPHRSYSPPKVYKEKNNIKNEAAKHKQYDLKVKEVEKVVKGINNQQLKLNKELWKASENGDIKRIRELLNS